MPGWLLRRGERRPRSRLVGCLMWILALIVLLIIASLLFGGFRKGTKAAAGPPLPIVAADHGWPSAATAWADTFSVGSRTGGQAATR